MSPRGSDNKLLLRTELDAKPLYENAERIEMQLNSIHEKTEGAKKPQVFKLTRAGRRRARRSYHVRRFRTK